MAGRLSEEKIKEIKEAFARIGTYSGTAKEVGVSASTVKKYVTQESEKLVDTHIKLMNFKDLLHWIENYVIPPEQFNNKHILELDEIEKEEVRELLKEMEQ